MKWEKFSFWLGENREFTTGVRMYHCCRLALTALTTTPTCSGSTELDMTLFSMHATHDFILLYKTQ